MRLLSFAALGAALVAAGLAASAASGEATASARATIGVTPGVAQARQRVELRVPGCSVGPERHWAASNAFAKDVTLGGKGNEGSGTATLKKKLAVGTYTITAYCGDHKVTGKVRVTDKRAWPSLLPSPLGSQAAPTP